MWFYAGVVVLCVAGLQRLSRWAGQPWRGCCEPKGVSAFRAWWCARRALRRVDVDDWAWELYVNDWYARNPEADDLMSLADELFGPADDAGEGGNR